MVCLGSFETQQLPSLVCSLRVVRMQDSQQHVGNGRAYAVCSCDGSESETTNKCGFTTEDVTKMAVACDEGYAVKVCLSAQLGQSRLSSPVRQTWLNAELERSLGL